ncbi:MAG: amidophosphoribosyltransferase [Ignavibacteriae bacterium]|nr:amidophosphoribosyltransferase [Ignavibacteriota bacterium]
MTSYLLQKHPYSTLDKPRDHCGVFGIYGHPHAAQITYYGLHALQHRGQEGSGIVTSEFDQKAGKYRFHVHKDFGLVNDVFKDDTIVTDLLRGQAAIGHNRYSTAGASDNRHNIQPLVVNYRNGNIAISHNGNLTNFRNIRKCLQEEGTIFQTTSDTEIILHLIARSRETDQVRQIIDALNQVQGAFSLTILTNDKLIAARDPHGWRPLAVGKLGKAFVIASETCAFDIIDATYLADVEPGEVLVFDRGALDTSEIKSYHLKKSNEKPHYCIFEYIYFSRPDSRIFGENVDPVRRKLGKTLAREHPVKSDDPGDRVVVINVPDSSNTATIGFVSENDKLGNDSKYEIGLIRSHYVGRTFIQPAQDVREMKVKTKFNTVKNVLKGKKVVIVDDSIVRGTTSKQLVKLVRDAGAKEIHFRVTSPPIRFPCHYGMDFPSSNELIANRCNGDVEKIRQELGVESLGYLSLEGLLESVPHLNDQSYCTACFNGDYPTSIETHGIKEEYEV